MYSDTEQVISLSRGVDRVKRLTIQNFNPCRTCVGEGYCTQSGCLCVCAYVCMHASVCLSVRCMLSTVYPKNRCSFELQMWICHKLGYLDSKLGF